MSNHRPRSVFFGTPDFAVPIVEATAAVTDLVAVVTQPDKPKGRGRELSPPPVKVWAEAHGLPVFQPTKLRDGVLAEALRAFAPDVAVVAAYGRILPKDLLDLPRRGCVNVHGSILPKWRGAAPIQWAIADGDAETGVTLMRMDEGLDTGDMISVMTIPIEPEDTAGSMHEKLAQLGGAILRRDLVPYVDGALTPVPQDESRATHAPILEKEHGRIDFHLPAHRIETRIRGFTPWPGAFTFLGPEGKELLKVIRAAPAERPASSSAAKPGEVIALRPLLVAAGEGTALELQEIQPENKRRMAAQDYVAGRRLSPGQILDPDRHA
ncbi:methionyl-tRNA formyltransferase [Vulgatibacter sp.]|uniref:methionyl-tRNA formyltransferase n=1 Tax=Vulgatibacter sp. TaxID=1971226 RepID=UPI003565C73F